MPVIESTSNSWLIGSEGKGHMDCCCGYGPLIFGHNDPEITRAIADAVEHSGLIWGPHQKMHEAASLVCDCVPCADMIRFTHSGTEATLSCIRLARALTKWDRIAKFYCAYHGMHESVLIGTKAAHPSLEYPSVGASSGGLPMGVVNDAYVFPFNVIDFADGFLNACRHNAVAVLVEPVLGATESPPK